MTEDSVNHFLQDVIDCSEKVISAVDPAVSAALHGEYRRQRDGMELIASENYQSAAVLAAQSSVLANKYSEGYPGKRYYGGQDFTDQIESLAIERACTLFGSDHANVQALSGAAANMAAFSAMMEPGETILGMDLSHGGHLTHGAPVTLLNKVYSFERYHTREGKIDYDGIRAAAKKHSPSVILAGFSAYPRNLDYARFAEIASEVDAYAYADMAHVGGLIAGKVLPNPLAYGFHAMMTTTHKSLRGPRGALLLSQGKVGNPLKKTEKGKEHLPTRIDRAVFPGIQGGPHMNTIAAIAVALYEAQQKSFQAYAQKVLDNAQIMAERLLHHDYTLVTGGTDNHMVVIDFSDHEHVEHGGVAENVLDIIGISSSKSTIPNDPNPPFRPSGLRLGIQAMTTRGMEAKDVKQLVDLMHEAWNHTGDRKHLTGLAQRVISFSRQFPLPDDRSV